MKKTNKKVVEKDLKTYEEWAKELEEKEGIEILDPDGFRNNPQEYYTKDEFNQRLAICTIQQKAMEKVFDNITKLKCDYTVYKRERTNCKMQVVEKCAKCGKKFKEGDELYSAYIIDNDIKENCIICSKCVKG